MNKLLICMSGGTGTSAGGGVGKIYSGLSPMAPITYFWVNSINTKEKGIITKINSTTK